MSSKDTTSELRPIRFVMSEVGGKGSAKVLFVETYIDGKMYLTLATPEHVAAQKQRWEAEARKDERQKMKLKLKEITTANSKNPDLTPIAQMREYLR